MRKQRCCGCWIAPRARDARPELFAGLVQACRYCGLLDESIAAYDRARRVDPGIRTSVAHAFLMQGDVSARHRNESR
jgi:hypothetical protein